MRLGPHACYHSIGRIVLVGSQLQGAAWSGGSASKGHTLQGLSACDDPLSPLWFILKQYAHSRPQVSDPAIVSEYDAKLQSEGLGTESFPLDAGSGGPLDISGAGDSLADGSFDEESKLDIADGTLDGQQNEFSAVWCSSQHSFRTAAMICSSSQSLRKTMSIKSEALNKSIQETLSLPEGAFAAV